MDTGSQMDALQDSTHNIDHAIKALERCRAACDLDERLRLLQIARLDLTNAWELILNWRGGRRDPDIPDQPEPT